MSNTSSNNNKDCPIIPDDGCSICGPGKCVTAPKEIFSFPNQPEVDCGLLEKAGHGGIVPLAECDILPNLVADKCKCSSSLETPKPSPRPTRGPTPSPTRAGSACPDIPDDGCSICGPNKCVTDPDAIFAYPNQPAVECGVLEKAGHGGVVPLDQCAFLPPLVRKTCKCKSSIPLETKKPTPRPTRQPTRQPTPSPTRVTVTTGSACPEIPDDGCSICGAGKCVTDFDHVFAYPGQPAVECGVLEKAGHGGVVPLDQCQYLPGLVKDECKCRSSIPAAPKPTHQPTPSPTRRQTPNPTSSTKCPDVPDDGCSICGPNKCVTDPDTIFSFPGQPSVACGVLEKAGHGGVVPLDQCKYLPGLVKNPCKCRKSIPLPSGSTPAPTRKPPTPSPTRQVIATMTPEVGEFPRGPVEPIGEAEVAALFAGPSSRDQSSSDGLTIGLSVGAFLLGTVILVYSICLMRKQRKSRGKGSFKDASTVGVELEADGSSLMKSQHEKNEKATEKDTIDVDPELL